MREKPTRAFEDFRANNVGGRSIRKRLARSSSIASAAIIASMTVAKAAINSPERKALALAARAFTGPDAKQDKRLGIIKIAANAKASSVRTIFCPNLTTRSISYNFVRAADDTTPRHKCLA
jgi:hypothetical protein